MRRFTVLVLTAVFALLVTGLFAGVPARGGTQEASPEASPDVGAGATPDATAIVVEDLGEGELPDTAEPASLWLHRATLPPGASATHQAENTQGYDLSDASFVVYVESGTLAVTFVAKSNENGAMTVRRQDSAGQEAPTPEPIEPGSEEVVVQAGDSFYMTNAEFIIRNPSDSEPAVAFTSVVDPQEVGCCIGPKPFP